MPSRYICSVLEEMRDCDKYRNYSYLKGLIEEAQVLANRMESALGARKSYTYWHDEAKKMEKEYDKLKKKFGKLQKKVDKLS